MTPEVKEEIKTALAHLAKDFEMLRDGEWVPDEHSCEASIDNVNHIAYKLNIDIYE